MISASGAYSTFDSPGPTSGSGWKRFHRPRARASSLSSSMTGGLGVRVAGLGELPRVDRLGGLHALVHERGQALGEVLAAGAGLEVHGAAAYARGHPAAGDEPAPWGRP